MLSLEVLSLAFILWIYVCLVSAKMGRRIIDLRLVAFLLCAAVIHESSGGTAMIGISDKQQLYTRSVRNGDWRKASGKSCCVISVAQMRDDTLVGVGEDNRLYTKQRPSVGEWEGPIPGSCCLINVAVLPGNIILGVTNKRKLVYREGLYGDWIMPENPCCVKDVAPMKDGRLLGLNRDSQLVIREGIKGQWKFFRDVGHKMSAIAVEPKGVIYGIDQDTCEMHVLGEDGVWEEPAIPNSKCMIDITSIDVLTPPKF
ncbi:uncharacterized protein [Ptychodera flava]|uniref:uncharacterized protein n=1 Tax=Ptychodera flava TaxID=63121 RepID=UPI003969BCF9